MYHIEIKKNKKCPIICNEEKNFNCKMITNL